MAPMQAADRQWEVDEATLLAALDKVVGTLGATRIDAVFMGGIASAAHGRPRWTHDIDVFVRPQHARALLEALDAAGFTTQEFDPFWLFKAWCDGVLVDIIFRSVGDIYLDDGMLARSVATEFAGRRVRTLAPEDLVVIKALAHAEHSPRHWHDALALVARNELDWDYLLTRARHGPRRVLSLLVYAQSCDLPVPPEVVDRLYRLVFRTEPGTDAARVAP